MKKNAKIGIGLCVVVVMTFTGLALAYPKAVESISQIAQEATQETPSEPTRTSNEEMTQVSGIVERVKVENSAHLIQDSWIMEAGASRIVSFTSGFGEDVALEGTATASGGDFTFKIMPRNVYVTVTDANSMMNFSGKQFKEIKLPVHVNAEQQLIITNTSRGTATISFDLSLVYTDTEERDPQNAENASREIPESLFEFNDVKRK